MQSNKIEPKILRLVEMLNEKGFITNSSCQGHFIQHGYLPKRVWSNAFIILGITNTRAKELIDKITNLIATQKIRIDYAGYHLIINAENRTETDATIAELERALRS